MESIHKKQEENKGIDALEIEERIERRVKKVIE